MRFRRRRRQYAQRAQQARDEVAVSSRRLEKTRSQVVAPLVAAGKRNQFADHLRRLTDGGRA